MKKRIIALSVVAAMGGFAGAASAQVPQANTLEFNPAGVGHINLVPYFSTQEGNVTAINIVNTDTVNGKVLKVRFRGASNSDDVYDFQVFLSPSDVWTAGISRGPGGLSQLATVDKSCTLPANVNGTFITGRVKNGDAAETREGYIEILNMGDIVQGAAGSNKRALYTATKHVNGVAPCTSSTLTALTFENASTYMDPPTTGLMTNWTIINVNRIYGYSGEGAAIEARVASTGQKGYGNIVYWDQRNTPVTSATAALYSADPLLVGGFVAAARYDFPDLSTPYTLGSTTPTVQARELSDAIATRTVAGEFNSVASLGAQTDWVVAFPTRRYFAAVQYTSAGGTARYNSSSLNIYFNSSNTALSTVKNYQLCQAFGTAAVAFWNREEVPFNVDDIVISPGDPKTLSLCGEVAVVTINPTGGATSSATSAALTRTEITNSFVDGWGSLTTPSADGLPMLVDQFTRYNNTQTNVFYGVAYPGRIIEKGFYAP
jgi:hypothetical protein